MANGASVVSVGLDWLTCTQLREDAKAGQLGQLARELVEMRVAEGWAIKEGPQGHGYEGISSEGIAFGVRTSDVIFRLSGELAARYWRDAMELARQCSRVDLQVTTEREQPDRELIEEASKLFRVYRESVAHRPPKGGLVTSYPEGQTLYCGSRKSDTFGRLYDKGIEGAQDATDEELRDLAGRKHRYEVEYKRDASRGVLALLAEYDPEGEPAKAAELVKHRFESWGIPCGWACVDGVTYDTEAKEPDMDRFLGWVRRCVSPGVERAFRAGRGADALGAAFGWAAGDAKATRELVSLFAAALDRWHPNEDGAFNEGGE